jgi:hypothetical protein
MENENIECFDKATLFLMSYLYDKFPRKVDISTMDIAIKELVEETGSHWVKDGEIDQTAQGGSLYFLNYLSDTLVWLSEEGYVRYNMYEPPSQFKGVVLSNKGLVLLQRPSSLDKSKKLVETCRDEFKNGALKGIQKVVQELTQAGVKRLLADVEP